MTQLSEKSRHRTTVARAPRPRKMFGTLLDSYAEIEREKTPHLSRWAPLSLVSGLVFAVGYLIRWPLPLSLIACFAVLGGCAGALSLREGTRSKLASFGIIVSAVGAAFATVYALHIWQDRPMLLQEAGLITGFASLATAVLLPVVRRRVREWLRSRRNAPSLTR